MVGLRLARRRQQPARVARRVHEAVAAVGVLDRVEEHDAGVCFFSPLKHGLLLGKYDEPAEFPAGRFGAVVPIWVTVDVPEDILSGTYRGQVTIEADGEPPVTVPLNVQVSPDRKRVV